MMTVTDLEPLRKRAVVGAVCLEPLVDLDFVSQLVLGVRPAAGVPRAACNQNQPGGRGGYSLAAGRPAGNNNRYIQ